MIVMAGHQDDAGKDEHAMEFPGIFLVNDATTDICREADLHNFDHDMLGVAMLMNFTE